MPDTGSPSLDWPIYQSGLTRELRRCICQLAARQRVEKVSSEDPLALPPARQAAIHQSFGPLRQRSPNLGSESRLGKLRLLAPNELSIEPGGTWGNNLTFQRQSGKCPYLEIGNGGVPRIIGAGAVEIVLGYTPPAIG
jgi:hypothetical protein